MKNNVFKKSLTSTSINKSITYGFHLTAFGYCLIGLIDDSVCHLSFWNKNQQQEALKELQQEWSSASINEDQQKTKSFIEKIFTHQQVPLVIKGTDFQVKVWNELLTIPYGTTVTYQEVAQRINKLRATRAVASAIGKNNISFLIPCHRVINKSGKVGGYRWGIERKQAMLKYENE